MKRQPKFLRERTLKKEFRKRKAALQAADEAGSESDICKQLGQFVQLVSVLTTVKYS